MNHNARAAGEVIIIDLDPRTVFKRRYKVRRAGGRSFEATLPPRAYEKAARRRGLTPDEFIERYAAVWHYDGFDGLYLTFEPMEGGGDEG